MLTLLCLEGGAESAEQISDAHPTKKLIHKTVAAPGGVCKSIFAHFGGTKMTILVLRPLKTSPNQKFIYTKDVSIDQSYLVYDLRINLGPLLLAQEPKNLVLAFFAYFNFLAVNNKKVIKFQGIFCAVYLEYNPVFLH